MQIKDSRYHKCWEIEKLEKYSKVKIGDSRKNKDGGYDKCTWIGILVGAAHNAGLATGDVFDISSGQIFSRKGKEGKWYTNVTVFELEVTKKAEPKPDESFTEIEGDSDDFIPF